MQINFKLAKLSGDRFDPVFLQKRRVALESFMRNLLEHPVMTQTRAVFEFLKVNNDTWSARLEVEVSATL
jgi:hypothetical protein